MFLVTAGQMQEMDRETIESFGIPGLVLMENAGRGAVDFLTNHFKPTQKQKIAIFAGRGNNGGDGFVIARYLLEQQIPVRVFLLSSKEKVTGDARVNLDLFDTLCRKYSIGDLIEITSSESFNTYRSTLFHHDLFVDAILGTGLNSDVRGFFKDAIELINTFRKPVLSIDIPSGLNADTGHPMGIAVKADATVTFAFAKTGHILFPGNQYTGQLKVVDIGIPRFIVESKKPALSLTERQQVADLFSPRAFTGHKGSYGHLLVIAGSEGKTGAAVLCANTAARCGTGLVTLGVPESLNAGIEPMVIEPMTAALCEEKKGRVTDHCFDQIRALAEDKQALAIGPGIGTDKGTRDLVLKLIQNSTIPMVIDADGLNCLAGNLSVLKQAAAPVILTPHPGEMARLCGKTAAAIQADRIWFASDFAQKHNVFLILKGARTIISMPDGRSAINPTGNPGMASGGMGDVLTGLIAGFCAQGLSPEDAGIAGVYIHGLCADLLSEQIGSFGFLASDMVGTIPSAIHRHL